MNVVGKASWTQLGEGMTHQTCSTNDSTVKGGVFHAFVR